MANSFLDRLRGKDKSKKKGNNGVLPPDAPSRETPVTAKEETPPAEAPPKEEAKAADKPKKKKTTRKKAKKNGTSGFALYIDCMPIKGDDGAVMFEDWMVPIFTSLNETVKEEKNLPSYLLLPYAEEKAMFAMAITEKIGTVPSVLVVNSATPGARDALGVLIPNAGRVVRAMR